MLERLKMVAFAFVLKVPVAQIVRFQTTAL